MWNIYSKLWVFTHHVWYSTCSHRVRPPRHSCWHSQTNAAQLSPFSFFHVMYLIAFPSNKNWIKNIFKWGEKKKSSATNHSDRHVNLLPNPLLFLFFIYLFLMFFLLNAIFMFFREFIFILLLTRSHLVDLLSRAENLKTLSCFFFFWRPGICECRFPVFKKKKKTRVSLSIRAFLKIIIRDNKARNNFLFCQF